MMFYIALHVLFFISIKDIKHIIDNRKLISQLDHHYNAIILSYHLKDDY